MAKRKPATLKFTPAIRMELALRAAWQIEPLIIELREVCMEHLNPAEGATVLPLIERVRELSILQQCSLERSGEEEMSPEQILERIAVHEPSTAHTCGMACALMIAWL